MVDSGTVWSHREANPPFLKCLGQGVYQDNRDVESLIFPLRMFHSPLSFGLLGILSQLPFAGSTPSPRRHTLRACSVPIPGPLYSSLRRSPLVSVLNTSTMLTTPKPVSLAQIILPVFCPIYIQIPSHLLSSPTLKPGSDSERSSLCTLCPLPPPRQAQVPAPVGRSPLATPVSCISSASCLAPSPCPHTAHPPLISGIPPAPKSDSDTAFPQSLC